MIPLLSLPPQRRSQVNRLVGDLGTTNLPGVYVPKFGGARHSGGVLSVLDDVRCGTQTGRYYFPGTGTESIDFGDYTGLNAATKATVGIWFTPSTFAVNAGLLTRWTTVAANEQLFVYTNTAGQVVVRISDGVATNDVRGGTALTVGTSYRVFVVYDGSLAAAARVSIYLSSFNVTTQTWGAPAAETITVVSGTIPPAMLSFTGRSLTAGNRATTTLPFTGMMDEVRVWAGTALTAGQVAAETLTDNPVSANLRYTFAGDATNTGSTPGFNGTPTSGVIQCSDDLRYGPPLVASGTARPAYDSATGVITFDGVDDYLRAVGGRLGEMTDAYALAHIGTMPVTGVANKLVVDLGNAATRALGLRVHIADTVETITNSRPATGPTNPAAGSVRVYHARRGQAGGTATAGMRVGSGAEVTSAGAEAAFTVPRVTWGGDKSDTAASFSGMTGRGLVLYNGNYASGSQYEAVNRLGLALGASL